MKEKRLAYRVSIVTIVINLALALFKLAAGVLAHSGAMISDAVHSASDVFSTFIVMAGISISGKKSDQEHPYGHERLECVASIILAVSLLMTGLFIGYGGITNILSGQYDELAVPGAFALAAAAASILVKEWMYWYTRAAAKKLRSGSLLADAWHHRSDALSSVGAFVGILGARIGYPVLDSVASVLICLFIAKAAVDIFRDAIDKMVDKACDRETVAKIRGAILKVRGVQGIDSLKTRIFGSRIYIDIEIAADGNLSLNQSHQIAEAVHDGVERLFPDVKHCMVHVNPALEGQEDQNVRREEADA